MAVDPRKKFIDKLNQQVHLSERKMEPFRRARWKLLRSIAGSLYGRVSRVSRPVNLLYQSATILMPHLLSGETNVRVTTDTWGLTQAAELTDLAVNFKLDQVKFTDTLRDVLLDALVSIGITKTALMPQGEPDALRGYLHRPGQSYTDRVSLDDFVVDPQARSRDEAYFFGNRYRLPRKWVEESGLYNEAAFQYLSSSDMAPGVGGTQRVEEMTTTMTKHLANELLDNVELVDLWLPMENTIVTLPWSTGSVEPLRVAPWEGHRDGPYDFLYFLGLNDNFMPVAPLAAIFDVDQAANEGMRKQLRRVKNMKHVLAYRSSATDDAQGVVDAQDLQAVRVDDPQGMQEFTFNGPEESLYRHIGWLAMWTSRLSGNTELVGGLGTQADTLGQEQILQTNANVRIGEARSRVNTFGGSIAAKHGWYMHYDPLIHIPLVRRPAPEVQIQTYYSPRTREGDWHDWNFKYEAYSRPELEPHVQAGRQMQWATEVVPTALELGARTGGKFPALKFIRMVGKMMGVEGLDELVPDEQAIQQALMTMAAYPQEPQGQPTFRQSPNGHSAVNFSPQMGGGMRDGNTVANARYSSSSQSGAMQPSGGR